MKKYSYFHPEPCAGQTIWGVIFRAIFVIVMMSFLLISDVSAEPVVTVKTRYYQIRGNSDQELRHEMNVKSQIRLNNKTYDAYTSWHVNWQYRWNSANSSCAITEVTVTVDVAFILPEWVNRDTAEPRLKNKWDAYFQALTEHENGHKNIGISAAAEIEKAILTMGTRSNCRILEADANALGYKILEKHVASEKEYDIRTNHGMKYGAVFP